MKLTDRRKKAFLKKLELHGIATRAARAASPRASSRYGAIQTFKDEHPPLTQTPIPPKGRRFRACSGLS